MKDKIVICIPGTWKGRSDFIEKLIVQTDGRLIAAGKYILDHQNSYSCEFDISPSADGMEEAFRMGSATTPIDEKLLAEIGQHTSFLSLYSQKDGVSEALGISEIALAALDCGGLAVRVEGSKRASAPERWREAVQKARDFTPGTLYELFVWAFICDGTTFDTVGMPFLGCPDISIETSEIDTATVVYNEFARYLLYSEPEIHEGHTIGFNGTEGVWRITRANHIYVEDPDIDFSRGMWRLQLVSN